MFSGDFVGLYDSIYTRIKDYAAESAKVEEWIRKLRPGARTLLDVACGTGEHARYLKSKYRIDGTDLNEHFLTIAREKNPECEYFRADMTRFDLGRRYDVVMSLFSSIGYVRTFEKLKAAIASLAAHLEPGGILIVEPWHTPETYRAGTPHMVTVNEPELKICRMNTSRVRDGCSVMDFHFLVGDAEGVRSFHEEHVLGLFTVEQMTAAFTASGLSVRHDPVGIFGRGLYLAERA